MPDPVSGAIAGAAGKAAASGANSLFQKWSTKRETRKDFDDAWEEARSKMLLEEPEFLAVLDEKELREAVRENASDPYFVANPSVDKLRNAASLRWAGDAAADRMAARFFEHFREVWKRKKAFAEHALILETIRQNELLQSGIATYTAGAAAPSDALAAEYCHRLANAKAEFRIHRRVRSYVDGRPGDEIALEALWQQFTPIALVGEGGLGKTEALRAREREMAALYGGREAPGVPVYAALRRYRGGDLEGLLAERMNAMLTGSGMRLGQTDDESARAMRSWLDAGTSSITLLLDGVNEVPAQYAEELDTELERLSLYSKHRIVTTSRESASPGRFQLLPLTRADIEEFLTQQSGAYSAELIDRFSRDPRLLQMAGNPFLLNLFAGMPSKQPLPSNRGLVLRSVAGQVSPAVKQQGRRTGVTASGVIARFLKSLAWAMLDRDLLTTDYASVADWNLPLSGFPLGDVLDTASESRFLIGSGGDGEMVEFVHPLFQEYFAAEELLDHLKSGQTFDAAVGERSRKGGWRGTLEIAAGLLDQRGAAELVLWLLSKDAWKLAFQCWRESPALDDSAAASAVLKSLAAALRGHDAWNGLDAVEWLADIGTEALQTLTQGLDSPERSVSEETRRIFAERGAERSSGAISALLASPSLKAENMLRQMAPEIVEQLLDALSDSNPDIRARAAQALGASGDPTVVTRLIELLRSDVPLVRQETAAALGRLGNPAAKAALLESLNDEIQGVRENARASLADNGWV